MDFFKDLADRENSFFIAHVAAIFVLAYLTEHFAGTWTTLSYPVIILLACTSFMWNYPADAIKTHGLFAEYLIELRILWLVLLGIISEYVILGVLHSQLTSMLVVVGTILGVILAVASRSRLQEKLVKARGFK